MHGSEDRWMDRRISGLIDRYLNDVVFYLLGAPKDGWTGAKSGASPTKPYRQTHINKLLYKFNFTVKVIPGNRTKLSLGFVVSCIASAPYSWRHKRTCIHVHVPYASCRECSLHSYSISLHQQHFHCRSFYLYYILRYSIKTLLKFPLTFLCYYCHITRFFPSQISLRVVYCSRWYFTWHWLLSTKGENFDSKWQGVNKFWLRWSVKRKKNYSKNLSPQIYNIPAPASI